MPEPKCLYIYWRINLNNHAQVLYMSNKLTTEKLTQTFQRLKEKVGEDDGTVLVTEEYYKSKHGKKLIKELGYELKK